MASPDKTPPEVVAGTIRLSRERKTSPEVRSKISSSQRARYERERKASERLAWLREWVQGIVDDEQLPERLRSEAVQALEDSAGG